MALIRNTYGIHTCLQIRPQNYYNPSGGYVFCKSVSFLYSAKKDNLARSAFDAEIGFQENLTNRSVVLSSLLANNQFITEEDFIGFKFNDEYSKEFKLYNYIELIKESSNQNSQFRKQKNYYCHGI